MEVCTVDEYNAPADHRAIIANIRTSALAAGWTAEEYRSADEVWSSASGSEGWTTTPSEQIYDLYTHWTGNEIGSLGSFLQLQSVGLGDQGSLNRWRLYGFRTDHYHIRNSSDTYNYSEDKGTANVISCGWPSQQSYSTVTEAPHVQNDLLSMGNNTYQNASLYRHTTYPIAGNIKQWVITSGTKFIHSIVNIDNTFISHITLGVLDLFDTSYAGGQFFQKSTTITSYFNGRLYIPDQHYTQLTLMNGMALPTVYADSVAQAASLNSQVLRTPRVNDYYDNIILQNTWSGKRVIQVPIVYVLNDEFTCPIGRAWYGILNTENLTIGTTLTYGNEEYQVWPVYSATSLNKYGIAYRIA